MQNPRNPVLLVHGIFIKSKVFNRLHAYLTQHHWQVHRFDLNPANATLGIERLASQIVEYVDKTFPPDQKIDLVGLSMGGLVSRYYLQRLGGIDRVERFVTIASPHNGTWMAYALPLKACLQMRPGSPFLQDLNQDIEILNQVQFTSLWTPYDFIIVPGSSSQVAVGEQIRLSVIAHAMMVRHPVALKAVANALQSDL
ncbi:MAG: alpha/beta fold hydrolase [Desertifilum sp. SIO1I2]|nr:alpha/beta fold hydrolase [Desertifilum sp. SIO1I2]